MRIPKNINRERILQAIKEVDRNGFPPDRQSEKWVVLYENKKYPPKYLFASIVILLLFLLPPKNAFSEYLVLGKIKGWDCSDYVLMKSCGMVTLEAVKSDGKLRYLPGSFPDKAISSYQESKGRCKIRMDRSKGLGLWSRFYNSFLSRDFYFKNDKGELEEVHPEYIVFPCMKK